MEKILSLCVVPRTFITYSKLSRHIHTSCRLLNSKDRPPTSSSSDSSDSDKEDETKKQQVTTQKKSTQEAFNASNTNERLNTLLLKINQASKERTEKKDKKSLNIAIKHRKVRFEKPVSENIKKKVPFEEQLKVAAQEVVKSMDGDPQVNEFELLSKVLNLEQQTSNKNESNEEVAPQKEKGLSELLSNMKIDRSSPGASDSHSMRQQAAADKLKNRFKEPSVASSLLLKKHEKSQKRKFMEPLTDELKGEHSNLGIFMNESEKNVEDTPQLSTWQQMENREIQLTFVTTPQNAFEEMIQWTHQGKLWHFPINNEQGLEEEEKVHFSQHVFMERHLKGWCPKKGPIRHFMELVCNGLSKNPYMTVEEKIGHITWYKDFFESKKDLLHDLDILDDKTPKSRNKQQIEA